MFGIVCCCASFVYVLFAFCAVVWLFCCFWYPLYVYTYISIYIPHPRDQHTIACFCYFDSFFCLPIVFFVCVLFLWAWFVWCVSSMFCLWRFNAWWYIYVIVCCCLMCCVFYISFCAAFLFLCFMRVFCVCVSWVCEFYYVFLFAVMCLIPLVLLLLV